MGYTIREFLEIRSAYAINFNHDGSKVLVGSNLTGTMQLYRVPRAGGELTSLTALAEPVSGVYLPERDELLVQMDEGGNERLQIYLLKDGAKKLRPVVYEPDHIHRVGAVTRDGATIGYSSNRRNGIDFDVYARDLKSGDEQLVFDMGGWCSAAGFSPDGRWLAVARLTERNADNDMYLVDVASGEVVHVSPHDEEASFGSPSWLPDGSAFFFETDHESEFSRICRYDMRARSWEPVIEREWDLSCQIDWPGEQLLVTANEDGYSRLFRYDTRSLQPLRDIPLPGAGLITGASFSRDGRYVAYGFVSPIEQGDAWVYDTVLGSTRRLTAMPGEVSRDELIEPELHHFSSFDRESIPAFVYRPRAPIADPAPVVIYIHGGPEAQYQPGFNPVIQYLLYRGFAVVAPNVRGSTGYGKRFHHLDDVHKRLDSVRDLEALHAWLPSVGLDPARAALFGGSYGGYMVLAGLAFQPELWAAGVDIVGISSLVTFLENTAAWRRKFREREYGSLEHDRAFLESASPISRIGDMRAPLLIIHGTNDPRVPLGEAEQIHAALTAKGVECELLVYRDEGHGLAKLKNRLDAYPKVAAFLERVLS